MNGSVACYHAGVRASVNPRFQGADVSDNHVGARATRPVRRTSPRRGGRFGALTPGGSTVPLTMMNVLKMALPTALLTADQVAFFEVLGARARIPVEPIPISTHAGLCAAVESGAVQLVWAPPLVALDLRSWGSAAPLAAVIRGGRTSHPSVLAVRCDEEIETLDDLPGRRVAWVSKLSAAGYVMPRLFLASTCLLSPAAFREQRFLFTHQAVLRALLQGDTDVGATYAKVSRSGALSLPPGSAGLRILAVTGFVPSEVLMATDAVSPLERLSLGEALRRMTHHELALLGEELAVERFSLRVEGHLEPLARMTSLARHCEVGPRRSHGELAVGL